MTVVIDTSILISMVAGAKLPRGDTHPDRRIYDYVLYRKEVLRDTLCLPAVALGELLCGPTYMTPEDCSRAAVTLGRMFDVVPYDGMVAVVTGRIFRHCGGREHYKSLRDQFRAIRDTPPSEYTWQGYKVDSQIVATAISVGATEVLSDDRGLRRVAGMMGLAVVTAELCVIPDAKPAKAKPAAAPPKGGGKSGLFDGVPPGPDSQ